MRFVDRVPNKEVPDWIRACDVVVLLLRPAFAQKTGAMPLKLFEYMAAGVPIVAPDLPSIREILTHGKNAWLVEAGNPSALAEGITRMLSQPHMAKNISEQAQKDVKSYTWQGRAAAILKAAGLKNNS
jgi:glycosyltransferase involved in cell wall biosynthesis